MVPVQFPRAAELHYLGCEESLASALANYDGTKRTSQVRASPSRRSNLAPNLTHASAEPYFNWLVVDMLPPGLPRFRCRKYNSSRPHFTTVPRGKRIAALARRRRERSRRLLHGRTWCLG